MNANRLRAFSLLLLSCTLLLLVELGALGHGLSHVSRISPASAPSLLAAHGTAGEHSGTPLSADDSACDICLAFAKLGWLLALPVLALLLRRARRVALFIRRLPPCTGAVFTAFRARAPPAHSCLSH